MSSCFFSLFYREEQQFVTYDVLYPLERETRTCENKVKESFIAIFLPESHSIKSYLSLSLPPSLIKKKWSLRNVRFLWQRFRLRLYRTVLRRIGRPPIPASPPIACGRMVASPYRTVPSATNTYTPERYARTTWCSPSPVTLGPAIRRHRYISWRQ